jgi:hypothetical protein
VVNQVHLVTWRPVVLVGPYLRRLRCKLALDAEGNIVDCDRIHSVLSGTARFSGWFVPLYHPVFIGARGYGEGGAPVES